MTQHFLIKASDLMVWIVGERSEKSRALKHYFEQAGSRVRTINESTYLSTYLYLLSNFYYEFRLFDCIKTEIEDDQPDQDYLLQILVAASDDAKENNAILKAFYDRGTQLYLASTTPSPYANIFLPTVFTAQNTKIALSLENEDKTLESSLGSRIYNSIPKEPSDSDGELVE